VPVNDLMEKMIAGFMFAVGLNFVLCALVVGGVGVVRG